jgi:hypothetical protein
MAKNFETAYPRKFIFGYDVGIPFFIEGIAGQANKVNGVHVITFCRANRRERNLRLRR